MRLLVVISITSHANDVARLRANAAFCGVLRLSFPDADAASEHVFEDDSHAIVHAYHFEFFSDLPSSGPGISSTKSTGTDGPVRDDLR